MTVEEFKKHWDTHQVPKYLKEILTKEGYSLREEFEQEGDDVILIIIIGGKEKGLVCPAYFEHDPYEFTYHWNTIDHHYVDSLNHFLLAKAEIPKDL